MYFNLMDSLEERINQLIKESQDPEFTKYLHYVKDKADNQKKQLEMLVQELDRNEQIYRKNMEIRKQRENAQAVSESVQMPEAKEVMVAESETVIGEERPVEVKPVEVKPVLPPKQEVSKANAEFTVGATVLSVVGGAFILAALVMLGMYLTTGLAKGLLIYGGCLAVMALAELLVYRKAPKLGMTLSAVGMGGLYISTLVNYLLLKNFNHWVALIILLIITLGVILLSRKRNAAIYRVLGMVAMYTSVFLVLNQNTAQNALTGMQFFAIAVYVFVVNLMCLCVPVDKGYGALQITHLSLNTIFSIFLFGYWMRFRPVFCESIAELWHGPAFVALSIVTMQMIYVGKVRWQERKRPGGSMWENSGIIIAYAISSFIYMVMTIIATDFNGMLKLQESELAYLPHRLVSCAVVVLLCAVPFALLNKRQEKWFVWYLLNYLVIAVEGGSSCGTEILVCFLILLLAGKVIPTAGSVLPVMSDAVITAISCMLVLVDWDNPWSLVLVAGLVVSVICIRYWKTYFEILLVYTLAFFSCFHMLQMLKLPVFVGMMFVGMLLFNNIERFRGRGILVFNGMALAGQAVCYLLLIDPIYRNCYLTYLCMLIFGVTTIVTCFRKEYQMDFAAKHLIMAIFLTYMGLVVRTGYPIVNSILLMLIALGCVGFGFVLPKKPVRIYGLMLSLSVCLKLVLYDFRGVNTLQKMILFFVVGVIALVIAGIYMIFERNQDRLKRQEI